MGCAPARPAVQPHAPASPAISAAPAASSVVRADRAAPTAVRWSPRDPSDLLSRGQLPDDIILLEGGVRRVARTLDVAESDFWSSCVRDFVQAQPEPLRRPLGAALAQYVTSCDAQDRVVLDRPLGSDARERRSRSDVVFVGTLAPSRVDITLHVAFCGGEPMAIDRVALVADGTTWTSPRLEFQRDANGCESAELPYSRPLSRVVRRLIESDDGIVRFEGNFDGNDVVGELAIGDSLSQELRIVLDAVDALNGP